MALRPEERKAIIAELVTNCDCWKNAGDADILNGLTDEKLASLKANEEKNRLAINVANAAVSGFVDGEATYRIDPETGKWKKGTQTTPAPVKKKVANLDEEEEETPPPPKKKKAPVANDDPPAPRKPMSPEEWFKAAPVEVQNKMNYLASIEQREKDKVIGLILVNVADMNDKRAQYERLNRQPLEDLMQTLALIPKQPSFEELERATTRNNRPRRQDQDDDMLVTPVMDWQELGTGKTTTAPQPIKNTSSIDADNADEPTEDEWLQNAPASLRNKLNEATAVVERERRKLIGELVANVVEESEQEQLTAMLQNKSVGELKTLLALKPKPVRSGYFGGAAAPLSTPRNVANDINEDVLPLPSIDWSENSRKQA